MAKRLLFACLPAPGHVNPTLPVVAELTRRGHQVTYATHEMFASIVEAAGATLLPIDFRMPAQPPGPGYGPERFVARMELFAALIRTGFPTLLDHALADRPDAVCYDMMTPIGRMLSERLTLPGIGLLPSFADNPHARAASAVPGVTAPDQEALRPVWKTLRTLSTEFGTTMPAMMMSGPPASLNIVFVPREFQYAGETFDDRYRFVGPSHRPSPPGDDTWTPSSSRSAPLLFVALGTASHRPDVLARCVEAFGDGDWQVAMSIGEHTDPEALPPVPANFEVRTYFPQPAVLRHAHVFVSHAGMNSTMESLHAGVPLVTIPHRPEQEANARRVEELGLGLRMKETDLTAESLRTAVSAAARDKTIRANVERMRSAIHAAGGATAAADAIEAMLAARGVP